MKLFLDKLIKFYNRLRKRADNQRERILAFVDHRPFASFFITLAILLALIVISNILGAPKNKKEQQVSEVKKVRIYNVGSAPKISVQAQVEKSGVIRITALTPGVIWSINTDVGAYVEKGQTLFSLSSNYQGGNTSSLQRQLAQTQYQNVLDTFDLQKDIINKQRDLASKADTNSDELRNITAQSLGDMQALVDLNDEILRSLDTNLANLEATNVGGANDSLILSTKQLKSQFLAANVQAKQALRAGEFNSSGDKPPAELSNMQKDLALKQLDLQEKMLGLNREISRIQLSIASVVEAMMFPAAPFSGTIQRISVKVGQSVSPGMELAILSQDIGSDPVSAIAYVSLNIAKKVSRIEPSFIHIGNYVISAYPSFVTDEAISGSLYGVYFNIPDEFTNQVTEKGSIRIEIPLGYPDSTAIIPYIPIDAVYQTKDQSFVYTLSDGKAIAKPLELGSVYGSYVEVQKGLGDQDRVILDRNVIAGDKVAVY